MSISKSTILMLSLALSPFTFLLGQEKPKMAILENKERVQQILNSQYTQERLQKKVFVLFRNKLYPLSDFDLADTISTYNTSIDIIKNPDSIKNILVKDFQSIIILKDQKVNRQK